MISNINSNYYEICKLFNFSKESSADINKKILLEMASRNEPRPSQKTKLGCRLCAYTNPKNVMHDKEFTKKIKKIRPSWFVSVEERIRKNKELFLKMARRGDPRPNKKTHPLGAVFCSYVNPSQKSTFDKIFAADCKRANPSWFIKKSDVRRKELIKMAESNQPKPKYASKMGRILAELTRTDRRNKQNLKFYNLLRKKRPDWFIDQSDNKNKLQTKILKFASSGLTKKQIKEKVGRKFDDYLKDEKFRKKLKKIRPDFFIFRKDLANEKKKKVLDFAIKNIRPDKKLLNAMYQWFNNDISFTKKFNKISPKWYKSKKQRDSDREKIKKKILLLAKSGKSRPRGAMGTTFSNMTSSSSKSYDFEFRRLIKKIRPDWFRK